MREITISKYEAITFKGETLDYYFIRCCVENDSMGLFYSGCLVSLDVMSNEIGEFLDIGEIKLIFNQGNDDLSDFGIIDIFETSSQKFLNQLYEELSMTQMLLPELKIHYCLEQS